MIPLWFSMVSLPPELCDNDIVYEIGSAIWEVIASDASFFSCNSVKILINLNIKDPSEFQKIVITQKTSYVINFQAYKGKIIDILKSDKSNNIRPEVLPLTSDFRSKFPRLSSMINGRNKEQGKKFLHSENQNGQYTQKGQKDSIKSIITNGIEGSSQPQKWISRKNQEWGRLRSFQIIQRIIGEQEESTIRMELILEDLIV